MISSLWFVMSGGILILLLRDARRVLAGSIGDRPRCGHHRIGAPDAGPPRTPTVWTTVPLRDEDMAPSSTYEGKVCFFDSIEHRDMFEANHHRPVAVDKVLTRARSLEQQAHRLQQCGKVDGCLSHSRSGCCDAGDRDG
jgi:hypothetical protein